MVLEEKEKISYIQSLMYMVAADGKITDDETEMFHAIAHNNNMSDEFIEHMLKEVIDGKKIDVILSNIKNRKTKLALIYELILICYVDREYTTIEKKTVDEIALLLSIESEKIKEIEQIIHDTRNLQEKLELVLEVTN